MKRLSLFVAATIFAVPTLAINDHLEVVLGRSMAERATEAAKATTMKAGL
jgi:hypothetical protein